MPNTSITMTPSEQNTGNTPGGGGAPITQQDSGPSTPTQQDILNAFWASYNLYQQAIKNGPDDPNYFAAKQNLPGLETQLAKMTDTAAALEQKAATTKQNSNAIPVTWTDENGKQQSGSFADYQAWDGAYNAKVNAAKDQAIATLKQQYDNIQAQLSQNKIDLTAAQDQYSNALADYKAQVGPMVSVLGAARDIADMTMRGPVIPAMLQNMGPKGSATAIVDLIGQTPGVKMTPALQKLAQDQPMPLNVSTLGTSIAQNALQNLTPWMQQQRTASGGGNVANMSGNSGQGGRQYTGGSAPASGNMNYNTPQGSLNGGVTPPGQTPPAAVNPATANALGARSGAGGFQLPGLPLGGMNTSGMPSATAGPDVVAQSYMANNPGVANPQGQLLMPATPQTSNPLANGPYVAGVNPYSGQPMAMH